MPCRDPVRPADRVLRGYVRSPSPAGIGAAGERSDMRPDEDDERPRRDNPIGDRGATTLVIIGLLAMLVIIGFLYTAMAG